MYRREINPSETLSSGSAAAEAYFRRDPKNTEEFRGNTGLVYCPVDPKRRPCMGKKCACMNISSGKNGELVFSCGLMPGMIGR